MGHLKSLNKYLFKYRFRLALGIIFIALSNVFGVYSPQVVRHAIYTGTSGINYYQFFSGSNLTHDYLKSFEWILLFFGLTLVFLVVMRGIFLFFMRQTIILMYRFLE